MKRIGPWFVVAAAFAAGACDSAPIAAPAASQAAVVDSVDRFPALTGRVVDEAGILTPEEAAALSAQLERLEQRTTDQVVVVTVRSLDGREIEDFARSLGNSWGIGQAGKDNGVLLVVAPAEHRVRIAVGYGLESILTDERAGEIINQDLLPNFRQARWHAGIDAGIRSVAATLIARQAEPRRGRS